MFNGGPPSQRCISLSSDQGLGRGAGELEVWWSRAAGQEGRLASHQAVSSPLHLCPPGTMRSAMLFAATLLLCLACSFGAVCEESQGQVAPAGRHSEVRCPLTGSSTSGSLGILSIWIAGGRKVDWWHFVSRFLSISSPLLFPLSPGYLSVLDIL